MKSATQMRAEDAPVQVSFRIPWRLRQKMVEIAEQSGISLNAVLVAAIEEYTE